MNPLILTYAETPESQNVDYSVIEYSKSMNLSVLKNTDIPAIVYANLETETFTKTSGEPSDTDTDADDNFRLKNVLDTSTETLNSNEPSDSDNDIRFLKNSMETQTITESAEPVDSDK